MTNVNFYNVTPIKSAVDAKQFSVINTYDMDSNSTDVNYVFTCGVKNHETDSPRR